MKTLTGYCVSICSLTVCLIAVNCAPAETEANKPTEKSLTTPAKPTADAQQKSADTRKYELRYKLKRGDVIRYEVTHRASIRSTIDETTQAAQSRTDSVKAWKVTDVLPDGDIEFTNVVEKVHMVNQLPDKDAIEYDSARDKIPPSGFEDAAKAVGVPLSMMRITPQGKVVRRDLKIRSQGAEDDAPIVLRLPEKTIAVGDSWDEPFEIQVQLKDGVTKMIQTRRHHKLTDVTAGVATIAVTYQVLSPIDSQIETQIVQRLMDGEARFDIGRGRVLSQQLDVDKRIIGFAGATSSLHYVMRMEERLLAEEPKLTAKPAPPPKKNTTAGNRRTNSKTARSNTKPSPNPTPQTANRQRATQPSSKTIRR